MLRPASTAFPAPVLLWTDATKDSFHAGQPAVFPYLPRAAQNTGGAVLIVPVVSSPDGTPDRDGQELARWLNANGVAGFVLRYDPSLQSKDAVNVISDVNRGMQYLRAHATEFNISPGRIGLLGMARGAAMVAETAYNFSLTAKPDATDPVDRVSSRPDFMALIWGSVPPGANAAIPPATFLVGSSSTADGQSGSGTV